MIDKDIYYYVKMQRIYTDDDAHPVAEIRLRYDILMLCSLIRDGQIERAKVLAEEVFEVAKALPGEPVKMR